MTEDVLTKYIYKASRRPTEVESTNDLSPVLWEGDEDQRDTLLAIVSSLRKQIRLKDKASRDFVRVDCIDLDDDDRKMPAREVSCNPEWT